MKIKQIIAAQRAYFVNKNTLSINNRINHLKKLKLVIKQNEAKIFQALEKDLHKSSSEAYLTEIGIIYQELNEFIKKLPKWTKKKRVRTPITHYPGKSYLVSEPYGNTLIISPWNYPFQLSIAPLIGAIAGGNTAIIKPSEYSFHTAQVIYEIISQSLPQELATVILGGVNVSKALLEERFDYIFFTGSTNVGKQVLQAASRYLTPVTLELGGKSPVIVTSDANLNLAAKRIVFGKLINAGQTCVAPDYLLVDSKVKEELIEKIRYYIEKFYGPNVLDNEAYPKIINQKHFLRLTSFLEQGTPILGGEINETSLKITPTIIDKVLFDDPIMQEEIFGPILPVITYEDFSQVINFLKTGEKPLALYSFTNDKTIEETVINNISFGGGCINDTLMHVASKHLPFGGVGYSGMGKYHGLASFMTFTHQKSIYKASKWFDLPLRYPPYTEKRFKWFKRLLK